MIELRLMTESGFEKYRAESLLSYADNKKKAENLTDTQAKQVAEDSFNTLLPIGIETPDHFLFDVVEQGSGDVVGTLWFAKKSDKAQAYAWVYDIVLKESARGKGYGQKTMELLEVEAQKRGLSAISLHVFGFNEVAQNLYRKLGFKPTNIVMAKDL
ncbi:MAG TPA: GNAT family N-acetyltransferase [Bdellovibrionales bacterium]|nr:GNAT family N-acetyltransferase [Bdellovibrionales bacterium]